MEELKALKFHRYFVNNGICRQCEARIGSNREFNCGYSCEAKCADKQNTSVTVSRFVIRRTALTTETRCNNIAARTGGKRPTRFFLPVESSRLISRYINKLHKLLQTVVPFHNPCKRGFILLAIPSINPHN